MKLSNCIYRVMQYIEDSEMQGHVNKKDSWFPIFQSLDELMNKVKDEEGFK